MDIMDYSNVDWTGDPLDRRSITITGHCNQTHLLGELDKSSSFALPFKF